MTSASDTPDNAWKLAWLNHCFDTDLSSRKALKGLSTSQTMAAIQRETAATGFIGPMSAQAMEAALHALPPMPDPDTPYAGSDLIPILRGTDAYPGALYDLDDPPYVIWVNGDSHLLAQPAIAVVGSRIPMQSAKDNTRTVITGVAANKITIISGMARGIDGIAHETAVRSGCPTIGVLGCGADLVYPRQHERLAREILDGHGALISEYWPGTPIHRRRFPARNRIIAALSAYVIVTQAGIKSGSLQTVDHALSCGREVGVIPGPAGHHLHEGSHQLIAAGADTILSADVALSCAGLATKSQELSLFPPTPTDPLLAACATPQTPAALEDLGIRVDSELIVQLTEYELSGRLVRLPDGRYHAKTSL